MKKLKRFIWTRIEKTYWNIHSKKEKILKDFSGFNNVFEIKSDSYEDIVLGEVFNLSKETMMKVFSGAKYVLEVPNAKVCSDSDIVICDKGVIWDKYFVELFSQTVPLDSNLLYYDNEYVKLKDYKNTIKLQGITISLLGKFSTIWAHFLLQFVSKLYVAKSAGLLNDKVTLLIPNYTDDHIKKVVFDYLSGCNVSVVAANENTYYSCDSLMYIPSSMDIPNHCNYLLPQNSVITKQNYLGIKKVLIEPYQEKYKNYGHSEKVYLVRRGTVRHLVNWEEIENWFLNMGFELIEPHKLSFEEKVSVFENAKIICGPYSAAFTNIIWCKANTKILLLSNYPRIVESGDPSFAKRKNCQLLFVTGEDVEKNNIHSGYYIPIAKIQKAFNYLVNRNE